MILFNLLKIFCQKVLIKWTLAHHMQSYIEIISDFNRYMYYCFQGEADRTLIYITLYITECLKKLQKVIILIIAEFSTQVTYCYGLLSIVHHALTSSISRTTGPILTKFGVLQLGCGHISHIVKMHYFFKNFFSTSRHRPEKLRV